MDLFVTKVSDFIIKDIDTIRHDIINYVLEQESSAPEHGQYSMRGNTGYHSTDDLCNLDTQWSKDLKLLLHRMLSEHLSLIHISSPRDKRQSRMPSSA